MATLDDSIKIIFDSYYRVKDSLHGYDSDLRDLSGVTTVFEKAGIATHGIPTAVVTGSKGKGSTSILCAAFLQELGHKVGLVTSPHLIEFRERIRINGVSIAEKAFIDRIMALGPIVKEVDASLTRGYISPTGVVLAAAMQTFYDNEVTAIVLEAGRGGRFDDVKIIQNQVACLTPIMNEHLDKLGPTIREVAWHKAGIIKPASWVITAPQTEEVLPILMDEIIEQSAQPLMAGRGILYQQEFPSAFEQLLHIQIPQMGADCSISLSSPARYLGLNASLGLASALALTNPADEEISKIGTGIRALQFPGRCQRVSEKPLVFVDGAINRESALSLLESILPYKRSPSVLVASLPEDKDASGFLQTLVPHFAHIIITTSSNTNLVFKSNVIDIARSICPQTQEISDVHRALQEALGLAGSEGLIIAAGTQSFVRDALVFWKLDLNDLWSGRG